jgi:hypothetical protein
MLIALVAMLLIIFVLGELTMTVARYSGNDIDDAKRLGQATVVSCDRHGPIGEGFGYWDECSADVVWDDGTIQRQLTVDKRDFFRSSEIGATVTIGDLGRSRGGSAYARDDRPPRPLIGVLTVVLAIITVLSAMLLIGIVWTALRERMGSGAPRIRG